MKALKVFMGLAMAAGCLHADINDDVFSSNDTSTFDQSPQERNSPGPYTLRASFDIVGKAKFTNRPFKGEKFRFSEYDIDANAVVYHNECRKEGIFLGAGYTRYDLDWNENPYFDENDYDMVSVSAGFYSHRLYNWDWKGSVKMNFNPDHLNFNDYVTWDLLLWGRYELASDWGFHAGFLVLTGMKIDRVYPIVGLDWTINEHWKVNAIFPLNFSVIYSLDCNWSFALASRFWDVRQRTGKTEPLSRAVWEYRNIGGELSANYKVGGWNFNAHVGYTSGGRLKISDRHLNHSHKLNFAGSPYVGAEVAYNF